MVRRRSTVRFRNGAPAQGSFSNASNSRRGPFRGPRGLTWNGVCAVSVCPVSLNLVPVSVGGIAPRGIFEDPQDLTRQQVSLQDAWLKVNAYPGGAARLTCSARRELRKPGATSPFQSVGPASTASLDTKDKLGISGIWTGGVTLFSPYNRSAERPYAKLSSQTVNRSGQTSSYSR
jgi:hypothetical protein